MKEGVIMKDQNEIKFAWEICNLISRLNDLIWEFYEDDFIEFYLKEEEDKYWVNNKDRDSLSNVDF